jgi:hypothetical protein
MYRTLIVASSRGASDFAGLTAPHLFPNIAAAAAADDAL